MSASSENLPERERRVNEAIAAYLEEAETGHAPDRVAFLAHFPDLADELSAFLDDREHFARAVAPLAPAPADAETLTPSPSPDDPALGTVRYFGDYELLEEIARGGMGVVYRARQVSLNRIVALKMILAGQLASPAEVQRFLTEAEAAANLDHPNIVPIYEVGRHQDQHYFSMKFVEGGSVTRAVPELVKQPRAAAQLLVKVARAVHYAHQRQILHRDLKPGNVLLDRDGQPHVTDFGLAKKIAGDSRLTQSGAVVGTPAYMPPEQAAGQKGLTTAADVYGLGAILYEVLTGRPPFCAPTPLDTLLQVLEREPQPPGQLNASVDRDLETICLKCLHKEPERRYGSAEALAEDLERWLRGEPIQARPVGRAERLWRWCRRNPAVAALLIAVALALMAGTAISTHFALRASEEARLSEGHAEDARQQRERAQESEFKALGNLYVSQMSQAWLSWQAGQAGRVRELLDAQQPKRTGGHDFRHFEWHYLRRLLDRGQRTLRAPAPAGKGPANPNGQTVAFRPGSSQVAWVESRQVVLADAETGQPLRTFSGISSIVFSPNGQYLAGVSSGKQGEDSLTVWDVDSGKKLAGSLPGHICVFSPNGKFLAVGLTVKDKRQPGQASIPTVRIWEWAADKELATLPAHGIAVTITSLAFSPDGKFLAASGAREGKVWEVASKKELLVLRHPLGVKRVVFSPDGKLLAALGLIDVAWSQAVKVWEVATNKELWVLRQVPVFGLAFSPDSKRLATVGVGAQVWDAVTGKYLLQLHGLGSMVSDVVFSLDGKRLLTASSDQIARVWDAASGKLLHGYRGHTTPISSLAVSPDNKWLATTASDGSVKLWDATRDQEARSFLVPLTEEQEGGFSLAFEPRSEELAVAAAGLRLWDVTRWRQTYREDKGEVYRVAYSADGRRLVSVAAFGQGGCAVSVLDAGAQKPRVFTIQGWSERVLQRGGGQGVSESAPHDGSEFAFSPDARRLAGVRPVDRARGVELWDLDTGKRLRILDVGQQAATALAFSPDGRRLAVAVETARDKDVKGKRGWRILVKDLASGATAATLPSVAEGDGLAPPILAFSPEGRKVLAAADKRVYRWDVADSKQGDDFALNTPLLRAVFSLDGKRLATGGLDGQVTLWDVATGQQMLSLAGFRGPIMALAFSPDGTRLAGGGLDGSGGRVKVWDARPLER